MNIVIDHTEEDKALEPFGLRVCKKCHNKMFLRSTWCSVCNNHSEIPKEPKGE